MSSRTIKDLPLYGPTTQNDSKAVWLVAENKEKSQLEQVVSSFRQETFSLVKNFQQTKMSILCF